MEENNDFGDFEVKNEYNKTGETVSQGPIRVRTPKGKEILGKVEQRAGGNKMIIACFDGKTRNCRVPGRLKRKLWIRPGNIVLIEPWEFEGDKKGDIIYSYTPTAIEWLKRKGFLKEIQEEF